MMHLFRILISPTIRKEAVWVCTNTKTANKLNVKLTVIKHELHLTQIRYFKISNCCQKNSLHFNFQHFRMFLGIFSILNIPEFWLNTVSSSVAVMRILPLFMHWVLLCSLMQGQNMCQKILNIPCINTRGYMVTKKITLSSYG